MKTGSDSTTSAHQVKTYDLLKASLGALASGYRDHSAADRGASCPKAWGGTKGPLLRGCCDKAAGCGATVGAFALDIFSPGAVLAGDRGGAVASLPVFLLPARALLPTAIGK